MNSYPPPSNKLDFRSVFLIPLKQFVWWLIMVLLATFTGYPGVVCITPLAWLIALKVGNLISIQSKSSLRNRRLIEAALAGGFLGLLQGILFTIIVPLMGPISNDELTKSFVLILIMVFAGISIGAVLSFFTAYLSENRREGF